jgi:hypothetical protein
MEARISESGITMCDRIQMYNIMGSISMSMVSVLQHSRRKQNREEQEEPGEEKQIGGR